MTKLFSYAALKALLLGVSLQCAYATQNEFAEPDTLVLGVVQFPPLIIRDLKNYRCYGSTIDHSTAILEELGYQVHVECMPAARLFTLVEAGKVDVTINISTTGALENKVTIIYPPYTYLSIVLANHAEKSDGETVAAIRGYDYTGLRQELVKQGYTFIDVPSSLDAINLFLHNRTSSLISYLRPYEYYLDNRVPDKSVKTHHIKRDIPTYFAISRTSKWHDELIKRFKDYSESQQISLFIEKFKQTTSKQLAPAQKNATSTN